MKTKIILPIAFIACLLIAQGVSTVHAADTLLANDFLETSWSKTIDFFDYARAYAAANNVTPPPNDLHAYTQLTYINLGAVQVLNWGLSNITANESVLTIPTQTTLMHFRTQNEGKHVITLSSFAMLLAFEDTPQSIHAGSPDVNDTLYASFSLGYNLSTLFQGEDFHFPNLNSSSSAIPLTHSDDMLNWHWGMKYTNLVAYWWRVYIDPSNPRFDATYPVGIAIYDELTFTYDLKIDPATHTATLTENHVIGRMRDLWIFFLDFIPIPHWTGRHYNSSARYFLNGVFDDAETIYQYLDIHHISMSVIDYQTTFLVDGETHSETAGGQEVADNDVDVSSTSVSTYTNSGEKISTVSFGAKDSYNLFNYTDDRDEKSYQSYDAVQRTVQINGYAHNPIFAEHLFFMRFTPLLVAHLYAPLFYRSLVYCTNMTRADYFYVVSYPTYSGYRIEHDPAMMIYYAGEAVPEFATPMLFAAVLTISSLAAVLYKPMRLKAHRRIAEC